MRIKKHDKYYVLANMLFAIYLLFLAWVILFKLQFSLDGIERSRAINLIPFHYENDASAKLHFREVVDNCFIFIPFGIYLSLLFDNLKIRMKLLLILTLSCLLECSQYIFSLGRFDITDLITNVVGGVLGICIFTIGTKIFKSRGRARKMFTIIAGVVSVFTIGGLLLLLYVN